MEPEGSLPHAQASATRPHPGLAQSSPHTRNLQIHPNIIVQQNLLEISGAFKLIYIEQKQNTVILHMVMKKHKLC